MPSWRHQHAAERSLASGYAISLPVVPDLSDAGADDGVAGSLAFNLTLAMTFAGRQTAMTLFNLLEIRRHYQRGKTNRENNGLLALLAPFHY